MCFGVEFKVINNILIIISAKYTQKLQSRMFMRQNNVTFSKKRGGINVIEKHCYRIFIVKFHINYKQMANFIFTRNSTQNFNKFTKGWYFLYNHLVEASLHFHIDCSHPSSIFLLLFFFSFFIAHFNVIN